MHVIVMKHRHRLAYAAVAGWAAVGACGCDEGKPAHASPSPAVTVQLSSEGFCSESAPSASATSCTCEGPPVAKADAQAAPAPSPVIPNDSTQALVIPNDSTQALVVTTPDWQAFRGKAQRFRREGAGVWQAEGKPMDAAIGRRGMGWGRGRHPEGQPGPIKRERDTRSPAGVFELAGAYGYAAGPPAGAQWPYRRLTVGWKCVDDPRSEAYNTMVLPEGPLVEAPIGASWDGLRREVIFDRFVEVRQNVSPVVASAGSCVLLHRWVNAVTPTQGCTSFSKDSLEAVLSWLSPQGRPVLVQLPEREWKRLAPIWGLPH